jgi:predicted TIM-barrel fold metal-dependent hydrolase
MSNTRHQIGLSRREFVMGMMFAATAASPVKGASKPASHRGHIDVHHHFIKPGTMNGIVAASTAQTIEAMELSGTDVAIGWPMAIVARDLQSGRKHAREQNEYGAQLCADHPARFGLFATLPDLTDTDGALEEIRFALDELKADGIGITTNYADVWLGDAKLRPVFDELNSRAATVFVHPSVAACCTRDSLSYMQGNVSEPWLEYPFNTARSMLSLMTSGTLRALPRINFIFCHGGGASSVLLSRISGFSDWQALGHARLAEVFPDGIEAEFRKLYLECAQSFAGPNMQLLRSITPASQLLYGSDYPHFPMSHSNELFQKLHLPPGVQGAISRGNAQRLLPRWGLNTPRQYPHNTD